MGHKILIVEDEPDLVTTCVRVLARRGYECVVAHTGRDGIDLIGRELPDLVLTDLSLPDIDGLSVLREARSQSPPVCGILMTAYNSATTINSAYAAGATFFLAKPFSNAALLEAVDRVLGESPSPPASP